MPSNPSLSPDRPIRLTADYQWELETDVIVVGFGASGSCAAIEAADAGAAVMVLELAMTGGGSAALSGGDIYMGGGTDLQKACGFDDTPAAMFDYLMMCGGPQADAAKVRAYVDGSPAHYRWLQSNGVEFKQSYAEGRFLEPMEDDGLIYSGSELAWPFAAAAKPAPRGHTPKFYGMGAGKLLMETLINAARRRAIDIRCEARVLALVADADNAVHGLVARIGGREVSIKARKGVILCAGGFVMNEEMLRKHTPMLARCNTKTGNPGDTGSGIQMGQSVGGQAINMHEGFSCLAFYPPQTLTYGIFVDGRGQRFINEDVYHGRAGVRNLRLDTDRIYLIATVEDYGDYEHESFMRAPIAGTGETAAELEQELQLPSGNLQHTLNFYNEHAADGQDPLFHKAAKWLKPLHGPLVALDCTPGRGARYDSFTLGGLDTLPSGEVLTATGRIVPGLYAAGRTACGVPRTGEGYGSGMSIGDATFSGRMAGRAAASRSN
jgi:succinate dehydrogenase/fumarate reductase flavoprotein subunit